MERINKMRANAILVNVGRGFIVNTDELTNALQNGLIRGAVLDVTEPEPLPEKHPLRDMGNVILTPHISGINWGGNTFTRKRILDIFCENLMREKNNELNFAFIWIGIYVVLMSVGDSISETMGIVKIVNLINGKDITETLMQICYAVALGFLFTIIFYKGKSLWPCIITHSVINSLSAFANEENAPTWHGIAGSVFLCVISLAYVVYIIYNTKQKKE